MYIKRRKIYNTNEINVKICIKYVKKKIKIKKLNTTKN